MALFKSSVLAQSSGSLAGTVFSHNRGGQYIRNRSTPTNPATSQQTAVRNALATLSNAWVNLLTAQQRTDWDVYAANVPLTNRVGELINVGGLGMYQRGNVPRLQAGLTRVDAAPVVFGLPVLSGVSVPQGNPAGPTVDVAFDNTNPWATETGGALLVFVSRPQNLSINFFKGPYRFASAILGDTTTPPTSPATITTPFNFSLGNRIFIRTVAVRADARLSPSLRFQADF